MLFLDFTESYLFRVVGTGKAAIFSVAGALKEKVRSTYHDIRAIEEQEAALEAAVQTARDALRVVQAQYKVGLVGEDKVREAEAGLAEAQANLYSLKCQRATLLATWRYLTGRPVAGF